MTIEEVKEYFKKAKSVRCLMDDCVYSIENVAREIHEHNSDYWFWDNQEISVLVYRSSIGKLSEIVSYKEVSTIKVKDAEIVKGIKENNGKLDYSEINFELLDMMAERLMKNKDKYPKGNMLKQIDIKELEWAAFRHLRKMIQPIDGDAESYEDHLSAVACNLSMILNQLKR